MSDPTSRAATTNPDYDLPGNDLDPKNTTADQRKAIPLIVRVYGALCALDGVVALPLMGAYFGIMVYRLVLGQESVLIGSNLTLTVTMTAIGSVLAFVASVALIIFGWTLMKSYRRDAGRWAYALIVMTVAQILIDVMLQGIGVHLIRPMIQLGILTALSATIDPTLRQERELQRRLRDLEDREAAAEGMLGRDLTGEGYIKLNFFNLFWVFMVCCVLGLIIEVIFHMAVSYTHLLPRHAGDRTVGPARRRYSPYLRTTRPMRRVHGPYKTARNRAVATPCIASKGRDAATYASAPCHVSGRTNPSTPYALMITP